VSAKAKTAVLGIRLPVHDIDALDALVAKLPYASRAEVARDAFRRGLEVIEHERISKKRKA
jgi:Arc/MetJ-type ribon-helix-helix transcriptional regulator